MTEKNNMSIEVGRRLASPLSSFHLEADRSNHGMSIMLSGIIGISDFYDDFILLKSHGGRIRVSGKNLFIAVYENNTVEIQGKVEGIEFKYGKN